MPILIWKAKRNPLHKRAYSRHRQKDCNLSSSQRWQQRLQKNDGWATKADDISDDSAAHLEQPHLRQHINTIKHIKKWAPASPPTTSTRPTRRAQRPRGHAQGRRLRRHHHLLRHAAPGGLLAGSVGKGPRRHRTERRYGIVSTRIGREVPNGLGTLYALDEGREARRGQEPIQN